MVQRIVMIGLLLFSSSVGAQDSATSAAKQEVKSIEIENAQVSLIQNTFIAAPIAGVIQQVLVQEGERVKAGHRLVQLDAEQAQTELEAAQAAYEAARLESDNDVDTRYAKRTLEVRQQELEQSLIANQQFPGSVSETEIAKLRLVVDQSMLAIEQSQHDLLVAKSNAKEKGATARIVEAKLQKHGVQSPVDGVVIEIDVEAGEWVEAGKPIVRVVSLDPIRIECFVDGRKYGSELEGRGVEFWMGADVDKQEVLKGKVTFVAPELQAVTGQSRLWATIANPDSKARAGMIGRLVIVPE